MPATQITCKWGSLCATCRRDIFKGDQALWTKGQLLCLGCGRQPTHFVNPDQPGAGSRLARAVCGQLVNPKHAHANEPSCPHCQQWKQAYHDLEVA